MIAFQPKGPISSFTAATSAPTSVQSVPGTTQAQQYCLSNTDTTNDVTVGWGQTDAEAKANAAAGNEKAYYLLRGTVQVVTAGINSYFTGITASSTAIVKVQCGIGN